MLNCDLTEKNTSKLDPYNNDHFVANAVTDFYDRFATKSGNECRSENQNNQKLDTNRRGSGGKFSDDHRLQ